MSIVYVIIKTKYYTQNGILNALPGKSVAEKERCVRRRHIAHCLGDMRHFLESIPLNDHPFWCPYNVLWWVWSFGSLQKANEGDESIEGVCAKQMIACLV